MIKAVMWLFPFLVMSMSGCATRTRSLILGGAGGVAIGGYAGALAYKGTAGQDQTRNSLVGAGIGLGVGLLTSYLLHDQAEDRENAIRYEQDERLRFGDLPPNPFSPANQRFMEGLKAKEAK